MTHHANRLALRSPRAAAGPRPNHLATLLDMHRSDTSAHTADRMGVECSGGRDLGGVAMSGNLLTFFGHG